MSDEQIDWAFNILLTAMLVGLLFVLSGCVTVKHWAVSDHQDMMVQCRATCGKGLMQSYEPMTGTCECRQGEFRGFR